VSHNNPKAKPASGPKGYLHDLAKDGFFKMPRTMAEILKGLDEHGHHLRHSDLTKPLQKLCNPAERCLRRKKELVGKKKVWRYSNW